MQERITQAIINWAEPAGMWALTETGVLAGQRRFDVVLVSVRWDAWWMKQPRPNEEHPWQRPSIFGVEIKADRRDFLAGVRRDQFGDYRDFVDGLYLACPAGTVTAREIPEGCGLLTWKYATELRCVRRPDRNPKPAWDDTVAWRITYAVVSDYWQRYRKHRRNDRERRDQLGQTFGNLVLGRLDRLIAAREGMSDR
jgi:hypothetical protein